MEFEDTSSDVNVLEAPLPVGGSSAGALVASGATLMRVENDAMMAVAIQRPRMPKSVLARALEELKIVPEEARKAYYSIPYREKQPDGSTKMVPVEGPSVKAAMALGRLWGNCSVTARILDADEAGAKLAGIFVDFETNFRVERPQFASKIKKARRGGTWTLNPQQWLAEVNAAASKAARNAVLNGIPAWLVAKYMQTARTIAAGDPDAKADPRKVASVLKAFERFKVTLPMLERYVNATRDEWMGDHVATLIGLGNALADKQLTVDEAFELEAPAAGPTVVSPATLTPEAIAGGAASGTDGVKPGAAQAPAASAPPAEARESGADDDDPTPSSGPAEALRAALRASIDRRGEDPPTAACSHQAIRPIPVGKVRVCPDCTLEVRG